MTSSRSSRATLGRMPFVRIPLEEREARTQAGDDWCRLRDAAGLNQQWFLRVTLPFEVLGERRQLQWGVWVEVSEPVYARVMKLWEEENRPPSPRCLRRWPTSCRAIPRPSDSRERCGFGAEIRHRSSSSRPNCSIRLPPSNAQASIRSAHSNGFYASYTDFAAHPCSPGWRQPRLGARGPWRSCWQRGGSSLEVRRSPLRRSGN
jgi:hypothetical protein